MSKIKILIWVDDERDIPAYMKWMGEIVICRTYRQAISALKQYCRDSQVYVALDHDLGCQQTGYDIAKYIVENELPIYGFECHSLNPVGRKNIEDLLLHYGYKYGV
jgi:hypothetical protein